MSINPEKFYNAIESIGITFFTGVPDSLLKEFCLCVDDKVSKNRHIITANEGNAIAIAAGNYLATKSIPLVYMQNSGLGNAVNPLLSLCDRDVYSIPMVLMIGWRGEPGTKDEPQHVKQGKVQIKLLNAMDIPYEIISKDSTNYQQQIKNCVEIANSEKRPTVLLIKKGVFEKFKKSNNPKESNGLIREDALNIIIDNLNPDSIIVSTTGKTSREIFEIREKNNQSHHKDFLTVGSMGHCSSIALGIAIAKPNREVVCIDGDGAMLMQLGSLTTIAELKPHNFKHILLNNKVHESVGGQSTAAKSVDLSSIVNSMGINKMFKAHSKTELKSDIYEFLKCKKPSFLEVMICPGSRSDLGRPSIKPVDNKLNFMKFIEEKF